MAKRSYKRRNSNKRRRSNKRGGYEDPQSAFRRWFDNLSSNQKEDVLDKLANHLEKLYLDLSTRKKVNDKLNRIRNNASVDERLDRLIQILEEIHTSNELRELLNTISNQY